MDQRLFSAFCLPFVFFSIFLIPLLSAADALAADSQLTVVRVGYYENPPKLFQINQGEYKGIFPEIIKEIAKEENWEIRWVPGTWEECLARLEAGSIDIMPDVAYSLHRAEKYEFSDEAVLINWAVLYTRPPFLIRSFLDLEGRKIAVMRGSIHTDGREGIKNQVREFNLNCEFIEFDSYRDVFLALQNEIADVGVVNRLFGASAQSMFDVVPTSVVFNPRWLKFAYPRNGQHTGYLKSTIDRYLHRSRLQSGSRLRQSIQSYLQNVPETYFSGEDKQHAVYLTLRERSWIQAHPRIRVGIDQEFAPFEFIDRNGHYSGYASDYISLLSRRLGLNLEIVERPFWKDVIAGIRNREIDVLAAVGFTEDRTRFLSFTIPYAGFYRMIFCRNDCPFVSGLKDLQHLKVAVEAGSSHAGWLREHSDIEPVYYNTLEETLHAVAEGRADVLIGNMAACTYWIRKLHITNLRVAAPVSLERQLLHMAVRRDWPELVSILDKGLASISTAESEEIFNRWSAAGFSVGLPARTVWLRIGVVAAVSLFGVGCFWFWNRRLSSEIVRRIEAEKALLRAREKLADKVEERTRELVQANASLQREMQEKEKLQTELHRLEKMEALGLMAGGVAHDLNNILAGIVSYPDLLLLDLPADSPLRKPLAEIRESGERAAAVVSDLLTVARGVVMEKKPVNLNTLITDYCDSPEFREIRSRHPRMTCRVVAEPGLKDIFCSSIHVRKCLMNLITNSFEAMTEAGTGTVLVVTENISIRDREQQDGCPGPGEWVVLRVSDTGPGISPQDLEHIFEPFYSRKVLGRSGTGLGLAIVWNTMQDHGGTVQVRSSEQGTTFTLYFPVADGEESAPAETVEKLQVRGNGERILVVDDEEQQREIACAMLDSMGYRVERAVSGEEALQILQEAEYCFDLVLLDMVMDPGMNGLQTFREILRLCPEQRVLIVSGFSSNEDVAEILRLGTGSFLKKPYTMTRLARAIRQILS